MVRIVQGMFLPFWGLSKACSCPVGESHTRRETIDDMTYECNDGTDVELICMVLSNGGYQSIRMSGTRPKEARPRRIGRIYSVTLRSETEYFGAATWVV